MILSKITIGNILKFQFFWFLKVSKKAKIKNEYQVHQLTLSPFEWIILHLHKKYKRPSRFIQKLN